MIFELDDFKCDVEIFKNDKNSIIRFFNNEAEPKQASDMTIVHSGYGYLCIKFEEDGQTAIISGYLLDHIFNRQNISIVLNFLEKTFDFENKKQCVYHHIDFVKQIQYDEYNGEFYNDEY